MIKTLEAVYTGGNIWIFWGKLDNGEWFLTSDEGDTYFLDASPENFDESLYSDWLDSHKTAELYEGTERDNFLIELLDLIGDGKYNGACLSDSEIDGYKRYWNLEGKTYEEIEENYCPTTDTTFIVKCTYTVDGNDLVSREVVGFYSGQPNAEDTEAFNGSLKATYTM